MEDLEDDIKALGAYRDVAHYTIDALESVIEIIRSSIYKSTDDAITEILKERLETIELNLSVIREDNY